MADERCVSQVLLECSEDRKPRRGPSLPLLHTASLGSDRLCVRPRIADSPAADQANCCFGCGKSVRDIWRFTSSGMQQLVRGAYLMQTVQSTSVETNCCDRRDNRSTVSADMPLPDLASARERSWMDDVCTATIKAADSILPSIHGSRSVRLKSKADCVFNCTFPQCYTKHSQSAPKWRLSCGQNIRSLGRLHPFDLCKAFGRRRRLTSLVLLSETIRGSQPSEFSCKFKTATCLLLAGIDLVTFVTACVTDDLVLLVVIKKPVRQDYV